MIFIAYERNMLQAYDKVFSAFMVAGTSNASSSSNAIVRASMFGAGMLSFLAFLSLLFSSTSALLLSGTTKQNDSKQDVILGVGPFVAGSSSALSDVVWWSDLPSTNACDRSTDIYKKWSKPNQLCDDQGGFVVPLSVTAVQVVSSIATCFSCLACTVAFSSQTLVAVRATVICSFIAMIFSCTHFAIWTTDSISVKLQHPTGDVIPLWDPAHPQKLVPSQRITMSFGFSYGWFVISFILLFFCTTLSCSIARLPKRFFTLDEDDGLYGTGKL
jgi:hypothetical protein